MKLEYDAGYALARPSVPAHTQPAYRVSGETARLRRVLMCAPDELQPVPCCSVTRESIRNGFASDAQVARAQHRALRSALAANDVTIDLLPPVPGLPDLCFSRDVGVGTPWGPVALNPRLGHRASEVDHFHAWAQKRTGRQVSRITEGSIEGGDICIARPGLLIVGVSEHRTTLAGAEAFAAPFRADGWDVLFYHFDEHFLHFDTIFSMLNPGLALGCVEVLEDHFIEALARRGIDLLPVTYKEARRLGCNVVSLDGETIVAGTSTPRVTAMMRGAGLTVIEVDLGQFQACGGGVHCLTMPLERGI